MKRRAFAAPRLAFRLAGGGNGRATVAPALERKQVGATVITMSDDNEHSEEREQAIEQANNEYERLRQQGMSHPEAACKAFGVRKKHADKYGGQPKYLELGRRTTRAVAATVYLPSGGD